MGIILYSTNCPKCNVLKAKLDQANVEYSLIEDADLMIEKGFASAPILEVDGNPMVFMEAVNWVNGRMSE